MQMIIESAMKNQQKSNTYEAHVPRATTAHNDKYRSSCFDLCLTVRSYRERVSYVQTYESLVKEKASSKPPISQAPQHSLLCLMQATLWFSQRLHVSLAAWILILSKSKKYSDICTQNMRCVLCSFFLHKFRGIHGMEPGKALYFLPCYISSILMC
jgi:hypothetical protein